MLSDFLPLISKPQNLSDITTSTAHAASSSNYSVFKQFSHRFFSVTAVEHQAKVDQVEHCKTAEAHVCQNDIHVTL